ncbi:MAG: glycosyltransferase family 2 protein [Prosthecobacter sp.]|nr:glycosyltransferase family 2 protein [Prosthecobacter sp.]
MPPCIIIPVHNRRATTLACLQVLKEQGVLAWATVVIVDDGSTDGTTAAVRASYPAAIILKGSGNLWWGGAINLGMQWAYEQGAEQVLWPNDDPQPRPGALELLVRISRERGAITTAQCHLRETGEWHYGGLRQTKTGVTFQLCPPGQVTPCDTICGNCVCIPRPATKRVGLIDTAAFPHFAGDADYGLRASAAGVPIFIVGDALCDCSYGNAKNRQSWLFGEQSLRELWSGCFHPRNGVLARCGRIFKWRHWGLLGAAWLALTFARLLIISALRLLIPRARLLRLAAQQNAQHQRSEAVRRWESVNSSSLP